MPIELIEQLGKHGLVGVVAAAVLYLAGKAIERGFSLTINAPPAAKAEDEPGSGPKITVPRPNEPRRLPAGRRRRKCRRARRRRDRQFQ
jgi:hypothetical protein